MIEHLPEELQKVMLAWLFHTLRISGLLIMTTDGSETPFRAASSMSPNNPKHQHCLNYTKLKSLLFGCDLRLINRKNFDIVLDYPNRFARLLPKPYTFIAFEAFKT
jgi:hypothetical protein